MDTKAEIKKCRENDNRNDYERNSKACQYNSADSQDDDDGGITSDTPSSRYTYVDDPPDGGWGWMIVVASHLTLLLSLGAVTAFGPFIARMNQYFDDGAGAIGGISGIGIFVAMATGPIAASLAKRFGNRNVIIAGGVTSSFGLALGSFMNDVTHLFITYGVIACFGYGLAITPSIAFIPRYFKKRYALANGIVFAGVTMSWIVLSQVSQVMIEKYGWRGALLILSAMTLHLCLFGMFIRPPPQKRLISKTETDQIVSDSDVVIATTTRGTQTYETDEMLRGEINDELVKFDNLDTVENHDISAHSVEEPPCTDFTEHEVCYRGKVARALTTDNREITDDEPKHKILKKRNKFCRIILNVFDFSLFLKPLFVLVCIEYFVIGLAYYPSILFLVARAESYGISSHLSATLLTIWGVCSLVGRLIHGYIIDRKIVSATTGLAGGLLVCGLLNIFSIFVKDFFALAIFYGVFGFSNGVYFPLLTVVLKNFIGVKKLPQGVGISSIFSGMAGLVGMPFTGMVYDATKSYNACYICAGGLYILSAVLLILVPCLRKCKSNQM